MMRSIDIAQIYAETAWNRGIREVRGSHPASGARPASAGRAGSAHAPSLLSSEAERFRGFADGIQKSNMDMKPVHRQALGSNRHMHQFSAELPRACARPCTLPTRSRLRAHFT